MTRFWISLGLAAIAFGACHRDPSPAPSPAPSAETKAGDAAKRESVSLLDRIHDCRVWHHGVFVDLGSDSSRHRREFRVGNFEDVVEAEREGASVSRVMGNKVSYAVTLPDPVEDGVVSVRAHGGIAKTIWVGLDDKRIGSARLIPGETKVYDFAAQKGTIAAGPHVLVVGFTGRGRGSTEPSAELDWFRIRAAEDDPGNYSAPTFRDLVTDGVLDGVPHRSLGLRAPASVRCPFVLARDAELKVDLGYWGDGRGSAEIRVLSDGEEPHVLAERKVNGGAGSAWVTLGVPLAEHAGHVVDLEFRARESTKGGRVLFGDPALVRTVPNEHVPDATTVVLVIASGLDRRNVPPWGPTRELGTLAEISRSGVAFSGYRTPTTVPSAVVASILTGLPPSEHALEDPAARLPAPARTLAELVKEASGRTAMFTGVPETFAAFGFDAGWDRFEATSPVSDLPATTAIANATKWLESELATNEKTRRLLVIHTRGGHPPWDVPREDAAHLAPEEYGGFLDPRRGGVLLSRMRGDHGRHKHKLADEDWIRLRALSYAALVQQDVALGQLVSLLKQKNVWDSTLFVFVGDAPPGDPPDVPFDSASELREDRLLAPLLVKFPKQELAAKDAPSAVTSMDLAATILAALHLSGGKGLDLYASARGQDPLGGRALVATLGDHYTTRLGTWLLHGQIGKPPGLCQLDLDPSCVNDVFTQKPIASWASWIATYAAFDSANKHRVAPREPASIDPDTGAALTVWGDI